MTSEIESPEEFKQVSIKHHVYLGLFAMYGTVANIRNRSNTVFDTNLIKIMVFFTTQITQYVKNHICIRSHIPKESMLYLN